VSGKGNLTDLIVQALSVNSDGVSDEKRAKVVAEALIAYTGGPDHLVRVGDDGVTVQHPLTERFTDEGGLSLFTCEDGEAIMRHFDTLYAKGTLPPTGVYKVTRTKWGVILGEEVDGR
jgi:hypothetical protein